MHKHILLALGISGVLLGCSSESHPPQEKVQMSKEVSPAAVAQPPKFIYLQNQGFSVSKGSPTDIIFYGDHYYNHNDGHWYRSSDYRGPWILIHDNELPSKIRKHRWEDIKRYRDIESSNSESRNDQYQRDDDERRRIHDQQSEAADNRDQEQFREGSRLSIAIDAPPNFIYLRGQGFSVSEEGPYDIVYNGDSYYLNHNAHWYRSSDSRGPWILIKDNELPAKIRKHRWEDIRRDRDIESRKSDSHSNQYQREDDNKRRIHDQRNDTNASAIKGQRNEAVDNNKNTSQQNKPIENRKNPIDLNKGIESGKNQGHENKPIENRKNPIDLTKGIESGKNQGHENKPIENRKNPIDLTKGIESGKNQGHENKPIENRKNPIDLTKGIESGKNQVHENKPIENRKNPIDLNKGIDNGKNQVHENKPIENRKNTGQKNRADDNKKVD